MILHSADKFGVFCYTQSIVGQLEFLSAKGSSSVGRGFPWIAIAFSIGIAVVASGCSCDSEEQPQPKSPNRGKVEERGPQVEAPAQTGHPVEINRPAIAAKDLPKPPLKPPAQATEFPGGGVVEFLEKGKGKKLAPHHVVIGDVSVWSEEGRLVESSLTTPNVTNFQMAMLHAELQKAMGALGVGAHARFWLRPVHYEGFAPPSWPRTGVIVELKVFALEEDSPPTVEESEAKLPKNPPPAGSEIPPGNARRTKSGLFYSEVRAGTGKSPGDPTKAVGLELNGWQLGLDADQILENFDLDIAPQKAPAGLGEVLTQMKAGGVMRIWVPPDRAGEVLPGRDGTQLLLDIYLRRVK